MINILTANRPKKNLDFSLGSFVGFFWLLGAEPETAEHADILKASAFSFDKKLRPPSSLNLVL